MTAVLPTRRGAVPLPAFFPDATRGAVRCVDAADLAAVRVPGLVMCAFHLRQRPGPGAIRSCGGLHAMAGWSGPILADSGGFQAFSMIGQNPAFGEIRREGIVYRPGDGQVRRLLTPEKSVQFQFACGADILVCLDWCTRPGDPPDALRRSVDRTVEWHRRCRAEYDRQVEARRVPDGQRPLLFGVIQGGADLDLRRECAEALSELRLDGHGFGGWPADAEGRLDEGTLQATARLMPEGKPKYAMGVGLPESVIACARMGYGLFDCVAPTREARHDRLYVFDDPASPGGLAFRRHYALDPEHRRDRRPVSEGCDCPACLRYSRAWLYHLRRTGDPGALRLATLHNLRFYSRLTEKLAAVPAAAGDCQLTVDG